MRNFKTICLMCFLLCGGIGSVTASTSENLKLREEIQSMLAKNPYNFELAKDVITNIEFRVNKKNEIVVINIDSQSRELKSYISKTLNSKAIKSSLKNKRMDFNLPIRFKAG